LEKLRLNLAGVDIEIGGYVVIVLTAGNVEI
jgi:hypothetical protein